MPGQLTFTWSANGSDYFNISSKGCGSCPAESKEPTAKCYNNYASVRAGDCQFMVQNTVCGVAGISSDPAVIPPGLGMNTYSYVFPHPRPHTFSVAYMPAWRGGLFNSS